MFFKAVAPKMHEIGVENTYFDIHVGADEHHSIMELEYIDPQDPESARGHQLLQKRWKGLVFGQQCCTRGLTSTCSLTSTLTGY